jgi:hypothetical protein
MGRKKQWACVKTLLIVAEGYHDEAFLRHVRAFEDVRGCGKQITIRNARGKGALGVIKQTVRFCMNTSYDEVAVLFDTDTDWGEEALGIANDHNFTLLKADPCLEAMLLRAIGIRPRGNLKKQLEPYVNNDPMQPAHFETHFGLRALQAARHSEPSIDALLNLLGL